MLHEQGYTSFGIGKWHNTPSEETSISGPYDRWPTGPVFGFDRFYGFLGGDRDQWHPKLFLDREAVDPPALPEDGYHLSEDLADRAISWISQHRSIAPAKPWLTWLAFGAMHAPHHIWGEWADRYKGVFDIGWDNGSPVSEDYGPNAHFTGRILRVDFDLKPDFHPEHHEHEQRHEANFAHAMIRQ
jgi:arylsulfatase A-like enzyme